MLASLAVAVLALILALVAPAIGGKSGPSTKKLAKQLQALQAQVSALQLQQGPRGAQGPQGPQGAAGPRGPRGPGAVKVDFDEQQGFGSDATPVGTVGELTVKAQCYTPFGSATGAVVSLNSSVPATLHAVAFRDEDNGPVTATAFVIGLDPGVDESDLGFAPNSSDPHFDRVQARATYRSSIRVITLDLLIIANAFTDRCQVQGTITPGS